MALELRPNCEYCDKDLPPNAPDACICSYECTFCRDCVDTVLHNVCPNCGGGFVPRPLRPETAWRENTSLTHQPASTKRKVTSRSKEEIATFTANIKDTPPDRR